MVEEGIVARTMEEEMGEAAVVLAEEAVVVMAGVARAHVRSAFFVVSYSCIVLHLTSLRGVSLPAKTARQR